MSQTLIIVGCLFFAITNAIINCRNGSMRLTFGDMTKEVNVFNLGSQPYDLDDQSFEVNLIENLTSEHIEEIELEGKFDNVLGSDDVSLDEIVNSTVEWTLSPSSFYAETTNLNPPSIESSPFLEVKTLPKHLKYVYLGEQETFSVIVTSDLTNGQEENLMTILRKHMKAIDWTMTYIKRLSPAIVQHCIHLNEKVKSKRDPQRSLNIIMQEVVRAEIVKFLDNVVIYPIFDSEWVSVVHAVPKKFGFTVVENDN